MNCNIWQQTKKATETEGFVPLRQLWYQEVPGDPLKTTGWYLLFHGSFPKLFCFCLQLLLSPQQVLALESNAELGPEPQHCTASTEPQCFCRGKQIDKCTLRQVKRRGSNEVRYFWVINDTWKYRLFFLESKVMDVTKDFLLEKLLKWLNTQKPQPLLQFTLYFFSSFYNWSFYFLTEKSCLCQTNTLKMYFLLVGCYARKY